MGGLVKSAGNFLGLGSGPEVAVQSGNGALDQLGQRGQLFGNENFNNAMNRYASGEGGTTSSDILNASTYRNEGEKSEAGNALATGATTGSKFATEQVQNNPILKSLFGQGGALEGALGKEQELQKQGFELKPEDQTLYGQTSGNIARMFGAQGNQVSQDLASRGLASAPSGAAGAMFSGLAGSQNEMLAKAQQQIMQQRFQNTMQQIGQQQQFASQLGGQAENAINQQYGRQLAGAQNQRSGLENTAGLQNQANSGANQANLGAAQFKAENQPQNMFDMAQSGLNSAIGAQSKAAGKKAGADGKGMGAAGMSSLFGV